jgi:hypothetical protein
VWNSEHSKNGDDHDGLDWFGPLESETLHPVWGGIMRERSTPKWAPQATLYWPTTLGYKFVSIYPSRLQHAKLIRTALKTVLTCTPSYLRVLGPHVSSGRVH